MADTQALAIRPATELAGLFDPQSKDSLTDAERVLIATLVAGDDRVDVTIPADIDDAQLWEALEVCCKVGARVSRVQTVLKMLVGRALLLMEERPAMFKSRGFDSLDGFMTDKVNGLPGITGISRSELYSAKKIATAFPTIPMSTYRAIGISKMKMIAEVVKESDSNSQEWIEAATTLTITQLEDKIYRSDNGIPEGSLERDTLTLEMSKAEKMEIQEFLKNVDYQSYCASALPAAMLLRAIQEASLEWNVQLAERG